MSRKIRTMRVAARVGRRAARSKARLANAPQRRKNFRKVVSKTAQFLKPAASRIRDALTGKLISRIGG
jgi:hypothetical protein